MLSSLIEQRFELGCPVLSLLVKRINPAASLYERLGLRVDSGDDGKAVTAFRRPGSDRTQYSMEATELVVCPV